MARPAFPRWSILVDPSRVLVRGLRVLGCGRGVGARMLREGEDASKDA